MKLVIYIIIVVVWILVSNYQRVQARKKKKQSGHVPHEHTSVESYTEESPAPKQKDLLEEILSQWTTNQPTVEPAPKPLPVANGPTKQSAVKPLATKHLVQPQIKATREYSSSNINTMIEDEISPDYIAQTEGIELKNQSAEFNLKQAVIHATILNRPEF